MKIYSSVAVAVFASLVLAGCGSKKIDSRQIDWNSGLAYEHGRDTPYTGYIIYKNSMPNNLANYWDREVHNEVVGGPAAQGIINGCTIHYSAGAVDGPSNCVDSNENIVFEFTNKNEKWDGVSKISNPDTGKVVVYYTWNNGVLDGKVKSTNWDGKDVLNDGKWISGSIVSGKLTKGRSVFQYDNGKKNGEAILATGNFVYGKGAYKDDQMDGPWVNSGSESALGYEPWLDTLERTNSNFFWGIGAYISRVNSNWVNGQLDGKISFYGTNGALLADVMASNGALVPKSGHLFFTSRGGELVPTNQTTTATASSTNEAPTGGTNTSPANDANVETTTTPVSVPAAPVAQPAPAPASSVSPTTTTSSPPAASPAIAINEVAHTYQAGFDCTRAQTPTETTICADPVLSALDADVAAQYHALTRQASSSQKIELLSRQRIYISARNTCGDDRACVKRETQNRLLDLRQQATQVPGALISTLQSEHVSGT